MWFPAIITKAILSQLNSELPLDFAKSKRPASMQACGPHSQSRAEAEGDIRIFTVLRYQRLKKEQSHRASGQLLPHGVCFLPA